MSHVTKIYIRYRMNLPATFPLVSSGGQLRVQEWIYAHRVNNPTHLEKIFVNLKPQKPDSNKIKY